MTEMQKETVTKNPDHIKRYSYQENYDYIAKVWERVAVDNPRFSDFQADDLITFFREFQKIEDRSKYFEAKRGMKRFNEIKQGIFRKMILTKAQQLKKDNKTKDEIKAMAVVETNGVLEEREVQRIIKAIENFL